MGITFIITVQFTLSLSFCGYLKRLASDWRTQFLHCALIPVRHHSCFHSIATSGIRMPLINWLLGFTQILSGIIWFSSAVRVATAAPRVDCWAAAEASPYHNTAHPRQQQCKQRVQRRSNLDLSQQKGSECTFFLLNSRIHQRVQRI